LKPKKKKMASGEGSCVMSDQWSKIDAKLGQLEELIKGRPEMAAVPTVKTKKPRAPLSDEQKTVLKERLVKAREAKAKKRLSTA
jgi:hypothetical protein